VKPKTLTWAMSPDPDVPLMWRGLMLRPCVPDRTGNSVKYTWKWRGDRLRGVMYQGPADLKILREGEHGGIDGIELVRILAGWEARIDAYGDRCRSIVEKCPMAALESALDHFLERRKVTLSVLVRWANEVRPKGGPPRSWWERLMR